MFDVGIPEDPNVQHSLFARDILGKRRQREQLLYPGSRGSNYVGEASNILRCGFADIVVGKQSVEPCLNLKSFDQEKNARATKNSHL